MSPSRQRRAGHRRRLTTSALLVLATALCAPAPTAAASPEDESYAAPQLVGSSTASTRARAGSLRVPVPPEAGDGHVLVAGLSVRLAGARRIAAPPGWMLVRADPSQRRKHLIHLVYVRVAGSFEPGSYRWSWRRRVSAAAGMLAYAGIDTASPVEVHGGRSAPVGGRKSPRRSRKLSAPSVSTTVPGALGIAFFGKSDRADTLPPPGATERYDVVARRGGVSAAAADFVQPFPGPTGSRVARSRGNGACASRRAAAAERREVRACAAAGGGAVTQTVALRPAKENRGKKNLGSPDLVPPETTIESGPLGTVASDSAGFAFSSNEPNSTFECRLDSGSWASCSSPRSYTGLPAGTHVFEVRARDAAGNTDPLPASRSWTVDVPALDTDPPNTTITSGPSGTIASSSAEFTFVSDEAGSTFECRFDAGGWESCASPKPYSGLADGSHTFRVQAIDSAGNVETSYASRTWTVASTPSPDVTSPDTSIGSGPSGTTSSTSASFSFTSTETGSSFECRLDAGAWGSCVSPKSYSGLAAGSHVFEVRATDGAGNTDASPASRSWTVESSSPPPPPPPPPPGGGGASLPAPLAESTGAVFHVAKTGSDTNPGSAAAPWLTVQKALDALQPGQRALVHAGTYSQALDLTRACTASAPCTVEAAPGEPRPVLRATNDHVLRVETSAAYWRLRGFVFRDSDITSGGLVDLYGHHLEISGSELTNSGDQAFYLDEASHHNQILGNWIHHSGLGRTHQSHGAYLQGNDHLVANNVIHDMPHGFGIQVYDKGLRSIITNNTITHNGHSGIVVGGSGGVSGVVIRNNVFAYNDDWGVSWDSTCPNTSAGTTHADHNVIYGNDSGAIDPQPCSATDTSGGNRTTDPLFLDPANRNLHLTAGSPALGYALPDWTPAGDHEAQSRPQGDAPDAGAYEDG